MNKWVEVAPLTYVRPFHHNVVHVIRPHRDGDGFEALAADEKGHIVVGIASTMVRAAELIDKAMEMMA